MKKVLLSFAVLGTLALASCDKIKDAIFPSFETTIGEVTVVVPIITNTASETEMGRISVNFNIDSVIKKYTANQFSISNATSIKVQNTTVHLVNGDAINNLSSFETIKLSVASDAVPTPAVIAQEAITSDANPIVINGNDTNLKEYLKGGRVTYTLSGKAKRPTTKPLQLSVTVALKVN